VLTGRLDHIRDHVYDVMPVVWCSKGLMNKIIWKESGWRFMEGGFIVVGVLGVGVAGLSLTVLQSLDNFYFEFYV